MKKFNAFLLISVTLVLIATTQSKAQVTIKKPLPDTYYQKVRPPRPSEKYFWMDTEWVPQGNTYVPKPAHWEVPPRKDVLWVRGEWRKRKGGYVWAPGDWERSK